MTLFIALLLAAQVGQSQPPPQPPRQDAGFNAAFEAQRGFGPDGFNACRPSSNAEAHLDRVNEQMRMISQLLDAELRQRGATPRLEAIRALLADDSEMKLARYFVQTIAEESCKP